MIALLQLCCHLCDIVLLQGMDIRPPYHVMDMNGGHLWYIELSAAIQRILMTICQKPSAGKCCE